MRGGESFGERIPREMPENINGKETYMDTKDFDARNAEKSRSVCERIHAEHVRTELSEKERRILDMWPKFEDGEYLWFGDAYVDTDGDANEVQAVELSEACADLVGLEGFHTGVEPGERVERPVQSVPDADGVEIHVGDTVYELETGEGYKVERVFGGATDPDFPDHTIRCNKVADPITHVFKPDQLTHTRRDSWERLEEDAEFNDETGIVGGNLDLVRRAKALAGVEVDA